MLDDNVKHSLADLSADLMDLLHLQPQVADQCPSRSPEKINTPRKTVKGMLQAGRNLRTIVAEPKRLIWAAIDKKSFESFLWKLKELNSFLIALLDGSQIKRLQEAMNASYLEILQIRNDVQSLMGLVQALSTSEDCNSTVTVGSTLPVDIRAFSHALKEETKTEKIDQAYLRRLAKIKMQYTTMLQLSNSAQLHLDSISSTSTMLDLNELVFDDVKQGSWHGARRRTTARYQNKDVWIDWKEIPAPIQGSRQTRAQQTELRLRLLTDLLCSEKPARFCAPPCLGYVMTDPVQAIGNIPEFGIVFQKPAGSPHEASSQMDTLRGLIQQWPKPSLSARMALSAVLARCMHSFHAVNWMHKGLRSDNIIFFIPPQSSSSENRDLLPRGQDPQQDLLSLTSPFVSGFELSRPSTMHDMTEKPDYDPEHDIYRHPTAQSFCEDRKASYRKSYDMYSLGLVLLELAFWQPIERLLGHEDCSALSRPLLQSVKSRVLGGSGSSSSRVLSGAKPPENRVKVQEQGSALARVSAECGDVLRDVIETCLQADEVEKLEHDDASSEASTSVKLQRIMEFDVVRRLESMAMVLQR